MNKRPIQNTAVIAAALGAALASIYTSIQIGFHQMKSQ